MEHVQRLSAEVDQIEDPAARDSAQELMGAVMDLYGEGLARILDALEEAGDAGVAIRSQITDDGVIASLLLIHDLYPVDLETRVLEALESVRPYMESHGGDVQLLSLEDGIARLKLNGSCDGCPASASTLELAIKQALDEAAPDLAGLEVEGLTDAAPFALPAEEVSGAPLPMVHVEPAESNGAQNGGGSGNSDPARVTVDLRSGHWIDLPSGLRPAEGEVATSAEAGLPILVANVSGSLLAFRNRCPSCDAEVSRGELKGGVLNCPGCERRFYLPRAGRSMDEDSLLLDPVPLLAQNGTIRIAVPA